MFFAENTGTSKKINNHVFNPVNVLMTDYLLHNLWIYINFVKMQS